jgi:hypothetical protein
LGCWGGRLCERLAEKCCDTECHCEARSVMHFGEF